METDTIPRVIARPMTNATAPPRQEMAGTRLPEKTGTQRVPMMGKMPQKQSLFDMSSAKVQAPWGAKNVVLLGRPSPLGEEGAPMTREALSSQTRALSQASPASTNPIYPEIDKILERQAAAKPLSQGEAQAFSTALSAALARVTAPENKNQSCVGGLGADVVSTATALSVRLSQTAPSMASTDTFSISDPEMQAAELVLECSGSLQPATTTSPWPWVFGGAVLLGVIVFIATRNSK